MRVTFLFLLAGLLSGSLYAMQKPYDFGDVPKEQLKKDVYAIDSTAGAVILFDIGESYVDTDLKVRFKRHVRIKILSDEGLQQGDVSIGFREDDPAQEVRDLDVVTYNLGVDGKIKKQELGRKEAYEEKSSDNWMYMKFSVPGLQKGSVFEYRYEIVSESPLDLKGWQFQKEIPVLWSEYKARIPQWFDYLTLVRSFYPLEKTDQSTFHGKARLRISSTQGPSGMGGVVQRRGERTALVDYDGTQYEWAMKNIPAIVDDPYINSATDYAAKVMLQLNRLQFPYSQPEPILTNWLDFIKIIEESDFFGYRIKTASALKEIVDDVTSDSQTEKEKIITLYRYVRDHMVWDNEYRLYINDDVGDVYKEGSGNGSEINMILVQLLREAGIDADPMILSTRSHGQILDIFPIIDQFNHAIAYAVVDSAEYMLDASLKNKPYHILPIASQNGHGLIIDQQKAAWVPLVNRQKASASDLVIVSVEPDGSYTGSLQSRFTGYFSFSEREKIVGENVEEVIHETVFHKSGSISIDSVDVLDSNKNDPFTYSVNFSSNPSMVSDNTEIIYFNPFFLKGISENPFIEEKRKYPVDFNFPFSQKMVMRIKVPEGWEVEETPQSKLVRLPERLGEFRRIIQPSEGLIIMVFSLDINAYKIQPEQYPYLREMFQQLVAINAENIVFKKL